MILHTIAQPSNFASLYPSHAALSFAWLGLLICILGIAVFSIQVVAKRRKINARIQTAAVRRRR